MTKLYIQDVNQIGFNEVIVDAARPIPVNLGIKDFTEITGSKNNLSFFSYTIDIPYEINAVALGHAIDINVSSAQDLIGVELKGFLESNFYTSRGFIKVQSYEKQNGGYTLKAQFLGGIKNWVSLLPTYLRDLELGSSLFDAANVTSIYSDSDPYDGSLSIWYSLKFYQQFIDTDRVSTLDMKPDLYFAAIINALEQASNTPIRSRFFATEYFRRKIWPYVGDGRVIYTLYSATVNSDISTIAGSDYQIDLNIGAFWTVDSDPLGVIQFVFPTGIVPAQNDETNVRFYFNFNITTNKTGILIYLMDQNLNLKDTYTLKSGANVFEMAGQFNGTDQPQIIIEGDHVILTGSTIKMEVEGLPAENTIIEHRSVIPSSVKTTDFISALSDLDNLVWFYDEMNEQLIVEPKWPVTLPTGEYVPGFYQGFAENYSNLVDCATEEGDFQINSDLNRNLTFAFKKDDEDKTAVSKQWAHTEVLTPKFPDGETVQENELFAPTVNRALPSAYGSTVDPAVIPWFVSEKNEKGSGAELIDDAGFDNAGAWGLSGGTGTANIDSTVGSAAYFSSVNNKTLTKGNFSLEDGQRYFMILTISNFSNGTISGLSGGTNKLGVISPVGDGRIERGFIADGSTFALFIDNNASFNITSISLKVDDTEQAFDFEPRVLYKLGVLPYNWKFNSASVTNGAPIAAQVLIPSVAVPVGLPEYANLGYADYQGKLGIVSNFYPKDLEIYKYGVRKTISLNIPLKALSDMEKLFRYLKFTNTSSGSFHVLENFQITINQDKVSEVDLIALP